MTIDENDIRILIAARRRSLREAQMSPDPHTKMEATIRLDEVLFTEDWLNCKTQPASLDRENGVEL